MIISKDSEKREKARAMLIRRASEIGRVPHKADFTVEELVFIKARLGPWPRALETAGLKEKRSETQKGLRIHSKKSGAEKNGLFDNGEEK